MKNNLLLVFLFSLAFTWAQNPVPNPGFENWSFNGIPTSWAMITSSVFPNPPLLTQSSNAHSGNSAAKLEITGSQTVGLVTPFGGFTINQNYTKFSFYYKSNLNSGAYLTANASLSKNFVPLAAVDYTITGNTNVYTQQSLSIIYTPPVTDTAGSARIGFSIMGNGLSDPSGSYALIDDVSLSGDLSTGVNEPGIIEGFSVGVPQPNPAHEFCLIPFSLSNEGRISMKLYTLEGKLIREFLNGKLGAGNYKTEYDVSDLPKGVYLIQSDFEGRKRYNKLVVQ